MKIVEVAFRFGAPGGVEAHVEALSAHLARRGHEVTVVTTTLWSEIPWVEKDPGEFPPPPAGVRVVRLRPKRGPPPFLGAHTPGVTSALLDLGEIDLLHAHSHRYPHLFHAFLSSVWRRTPLVVTPHYHPAEDGLPLGKRLGARILDFLQGGTVYTRASRVVAVTELEKRFLDFVPPSKIVTIPNGIEFEEWENPEGDPPFPTPYILYSGRLASNKGLENLLWAHSKLPFDVHLVLGGADWGVGESLRALCRTLGTLERVHFAGHLPRESYRRAMKGCSLFVLPSRWEAFGIVLLEAQAAGKPVVATRVGGIPEVVVEGKTGILVDPDDPGALHRAIESLLRNPDLQRFFGENGRRHARRYDWKVVVDRIEKTFQEARGEFRFEEPMASRRVAGGRS